MLLAGASDPDAQVKKVGPGLIFGRLWDGAGIADHILELLSGRRYRFEVERAIFVTVFNRLVNPGSDRQAEKWHQAYRINGAEKLQIQHFYRVIAWLGEPLKSKTAEEGFSPRCVKDESCLMQNDHERKRLIAHVNDEKRWVDMNMWITREKFEELSTYSYHYDSDYFSDSFISGSFLD